MSKELYKKHSRLIESLAKIKGKKFARGYYSAEDIEQEVRLKCFIAISKFSKEKANKTDGAMKTFLNVVTENHLRNLMRDKFSVYNPPCKHKHSHFDRDGCYDDSAWECKEFAKYWEKYRAKKTIRNPMRFSDITKNFEQFVVKCSSSEPGSLTMVNEDVLSQLKKSSYDLWLAYQAKLNGVNLPAELETRLIMAILE